MNASKKRCKKEVENQRAKIRAKGAEHAHAHAHTTNNKQRTAGITNQNVLERVTIKLFAQMRDHIRQNIIQIVAYEASAQ